MLERQRDIFPLPLVDAKIGIELCVLHDECDLISFDVVVRVANLSLQALNALAGFVAPDARRGSCAPQRAAQLRAFSQAHAWLYSVYRAKPPSPEVAFGRLIHDEVYGVYC